MMGAEAFARGSEVTFARTPNLLTAAHEAAHVIQQRSGVDDRENRDVYERHADEVAARVGRGESSEELLDASPGMGRTAAQYPPIVQMRRIPPNIRALLTATSGGPGANFSANEIGAQRLIDHALEELTPAEKAKVDTARLNGLTDAQFNALATEEQRSRWAEAILAQFPDRQLGDPNLIDTGARPGKPDAANITKLVGHAEQIFADVASGTRDTWITQVFGAGSVGKAKAKYAKARTAMNKLHGSDSIVTDRSGYSDEVSLGGLTDPPGTKNQKIRLNESFIDSPDDDDSVTTLVHESMHAGNADIDDKYPSSTGFTTEKEAKKLIFASYFEVVAWRALDPTATDAFAVVPATTPPTFQTFIPAGTTVSGVAAPAQTKVEKGATAAGDLFRAAWTTGLNLHPFYVGLFKAPAKWKVPQADYGYNRFDKALPYWSKVQKLTIHLKTSIDTTSADEAKHPVSQIDIALSEGLIRRLANGMGVLDSLHTEAEVLAFETANSTAAEQTAAFPGGAHTSENAERDFLLKLAARDSTVAPMTGDVARDVRVVRELGNLNWDTVLYPRNPASFAD